MNPNIPELIKLITTQMTADADKQYESPLDRLESNSAKALKFAEQLWRVRTYYNRKKLEYDQKYAVAYKKFKFGSAYLAKSKQDIDALIEAEDEELMKLKGNCKTLEALAEVLENAVEIYKMREATERMIFKHKTGVE